MERREIERERERERERGRKINLVPDYLIVNQVRMAKTPVAKMES